jgi:hypothetical protein
MTTLLNGTLRRIGGDYQWIDGTWETRVKTMRLRDMGPNFRINTDPEHGHIVEIPKQWREPRYWSGQHVDTDAKAAIERLIADLPIEMIYAEGTAEAIGDHRLQRPGYRVPINQWDIAMNEQCGIWWDKADEADILAKAESLHG